jgi:hypothetical protein
LLLPFIDRHLASWREETRVFREADASSAELRARLLGNLTRLSPVLMTANLVNGIGLALSLSDAVDPLALMAWLGVLGLLVAMGLRNWLRHRRRPASRASPRAVQHASRNAFALALVWSVPPLAWIDAGQPMQQLMVAVTATGMMAAGAFALSSIPQAGLAWTLALGHAGRCRRGVAQCVSDSHRGCQPGGAWKTRDYPSHSIDSAIVIRIAGGG